MNSNKCFFLGIYSIKYSFSCFFGGRLSVIPAHKQTPIGWYHINIKTYELTNTTRLLSDHIHTSTHKTQKLAQIHTQITHTHTQLPWYSCRRPGPRSSVPRRAGLPQESRTPRRRTPCVSARDKYDRWISQVDKIKNRLILRLIDRWMDRYTNIHGWMDGWMDGWAQDRKIDKQINSLININRYK